MSEKNFEEDQERGYHIAVARQKKLYIFGGVKCVFDEDRTRKEFPKCKSYIPLTYVDVYDLADESSGSPVRRKTNISTNLENAACCIYGNAIFMFGGWDGRTHLGEMRMFNLETFLWEEIFPSMQDAKIPTARAGHSMVVTYNGQFFLFGGQGPASKKPEEFEITEFFQSDKYSNDLFNNQSLLYHPQENTWRCLTPANTPPSPRAYHSCVAVRELIFLYGGRNSTKETMNDLWSFDLNTMYWNRVKPNVPELPTLYRHTMNAIGTNSLFICGGWESTGKLSSNIAWLYNIDENSWENVDSTCSLKSRAGHTATNLDDNVLVVYGGEICTPTSKRCLSGEMNIVKFSPNDGTFKVSWCKNIMS